jgi:carboxypeptidase family protein
MRRFLRDVSVGALLYLLATAPAWAQATAQLNGRVTDESGAVLPGVTVTATQTDTTVARAVVTDASGNYVMTNLPTGPYRLEIALQGFRTYVQTGIVLQVGASPTINATLGVGNLEQTVSVEAAAPLVDVRSAGISEVVDQQRIVELPLQGRQVTDLIVLAGAAVETGRPNNRSFQGGVNISVAGGLQFGVAYSLDGAVHNDPQNSGGLPLPFPDALQEFRVATSGLSAQSGMHSGASVNAVTKSGTNRYSGNVFEFVRDKRFNAKSPLAPIGPDGKRVDDGLKRNQYGGTIGGPVVRDRIFFFAGYQGTRTPCDASRSGCARTNRDDAGRRLHRVCLARVRRRATGQSWRGFLGKSNRSVALQSGRIEPRPAASDDDGSVRRDAVQSAGRSR